MISFLYPSLLRRFAVLLTDLRVGTVLLFVVSTFEFITIRNKIRWKGLGEINRGPLLSSFLYRFVVNIVPFPIWWWGCGIWSSWRTLCRKRVPNALSVRNCNAIFQWYLLLNLFITTDKCCSKANESSEGKASISENQETNLKGLSLTE